MPPRAKLSVFGKNIHECGTARMGNDPKKSVVNRFNQVTTPGMYSSPTAPAS